MKKVQFFLACSALLVSTLAAGCPCQKRPVKPPVPLNIENEVLFANNATKSRPGPSDVTFIASSVTGNGCGCGQKRQPVKKAAPTKELIQTENRVEKDPMPAELENAIYRDIAKMAEKNRKLIGGKKAPQTTDNLNLHARDPYYKSTYQTSSHFIEIIDGLGSSVQIQDGTVWGIKDSDRYIVKNWHVNTEITVKPNTLTIWNKLTGTRPEHKYRLVNLATGESVAATMSFGPFEQHPLTRVIDHIDYYRGEIILSNGTIWKVDNTRPSMRILEDWKINHAIITGLNDTWFSLGSPYILVNVQKENWLAVTRVR
ncbi:MAG: hypothetical protein LLF94_06985 [Chlamydiales bacterium]|nr:hypothetical protein [Chlamydiales bacterium]